MAGVEDMANLLTASRGGERVGKHWVRRFIDRNPDLKPRMNRRYDYQRPLCEDPDVISGWFGLVANIKAKYGIVDERHVQFRRHRLYDGHDRINPRRNTRRPAWEGQVGPAWQSGMVNGNCMHQFARLVHPAVLDRSGPISPLELGERMRPTARLGLDWIKHFDEHTKGHRKSRYRLLILDGHESHISAEFEAYCKSNDIITISMPPHSSHLLQPLDVALYSPLKRAYSKEIELFIKASINHITKLEFFIAFKAAHFAIFTETNIRSEFSASGLVPHNPDEVIGKLDVRLRTPTPVSSRPGTASTYVPQTPFNPQQTTKHSSFIKSKVSAHQGSSPTPILEAVDQMAKGMTKMAHEMTLMRDRIRTLEEANLALSKRRRAKKSRVQLGGALTSEESQAFQEAKDKGKRLATDKAENGGPSKRRVAGVKRYNTCEPGSELESGLF
ncbi:Pogo transposable element with KRAB domain [Apiospora arundinis]|uniref:Pogo transposable element with KRAB domain n=1 Tax=Apiospora arundinis TaxID=335852 RepID=A0ABR2J477_9PEZI